MGGSAVCYKDHARESNVLLKLSVVLIQARYHHAYMLFLTLPRTSPQNRHYPPR